jgi:hypothetical protein
LDFGKIVATAASKSKKLTLHNGGRVAVSIGQLIAPTSFSISNDNCSNSNGMSGEKSLLQPGQHCSLDVQFAPLTPVGKVTEIFYSADGERMADTELLEGNGIGVTLTAPRIENFPSVAPGSISKTTKSIKIKNPTDATVQLGAASALTDFMITADGCANTMLASKASCVVTAEFTPQASDSPGSVSNTLDYNFTYGTNSGSVAVELKGKVS